MIVVYILILTLCHTINGTYKAKRDLADLKNDPLLASVFEFKHDDRRSLNQTISTADQFQKRDTTDTTLLPELMTLNKEANESSPNEPIISNPVDLPESDSSAIYSLSPMSSSDSAVSPDLVASNFLPLPSETPEVSKKSNVLRGSSQPLQLTVHSPNADIMGIAPHITEYDKEKKSKVEDESKDKKQFIPQVPMMNNMYYQQYQTPQFANFMQQSPMNVQQSAIQQVFPQQNMLMQQAYSNPTSQELQAPQQVVSQQAVQQLQQLQQQKVEQQTVQTAQTAQQTAQQAAKETPSTEGPCTDQYAMCNEFAKNNYCTNYPQLMKIQCRKACAFCVAPENKTEPAPSKVEPALTKKSHHHKNKTATPAVTVVTHHQETGSGDAMIEGSGSGEPAAKVTKKTEKVAQHKSSSKKASKKHDILQERHHTDELNGSGSGVSEEIGSGEAESGSGATESIDAPPKVIKVKVVPTKQNNTKLQGKKSSKDAKTKKIKQVKEVKTVRSNIPENNVPQLHSNLGEFTLPAKKSHAPASSLAFADKNDDDDSGSGSGSGDDGGYVQVKSKIVAKKISAAKNKSVKKAPKTANVVKPTFKPALKNTKGKNSTAQKKSTKATDIKTTKKIENKKKEKNQKKSTVPAPVKQKTNKKKDSHKKSKVKQNGNKKKQKSRKGKKKSATKLSAPSATQKKDVVPSPPQVAPPSVMAFGSSYPRIDLRAIATALAKYESAALELAGEYPKPSQFDMTEYQRSSIPHPRQPAIVNPRQHFIDNEKAAKFVEADLQKKNVIPKYLRISKEAKDTDEVPKDSADADSLDSVRQRFLIPGVEPTLNDYYSETGKINPFASKTKNYKKSRIVRRMNSSADPYEYLRNMVPGSSMEPIADPHKRNNILSDHSYPVFLMKVSPADKKYKPEEASKRGKVHRVNAEGLPVDESKTHPAPAPAAFQPMIPAALAAPLTMPMFNPFAAMQAPPPAPFVPPSQAYFAAPQQPAAPVAFYQPPPASPVAQPSPQNAAIAPPLDFTVDQLTVPQTNAAFSKEEQITPEKQPGANSLRSKMLSAFFNVKTGENEDEGSGGGSGDGSLRNHEGSGGGEDATGSRKSMTLHNLFSDEDVGANYLKSNLAALTPEKPSDAATHVQMSKTQETNWMRPNPQSELASAMPFPEQQTDFQYFGRTPGNIFVATHKKKAQKKKAVAHTNGHKKSPIRHAPITQPQQHHVVKTITAKPAHKIDGEVSDATLSSKFSTHKQPINNNRNPALHDNNPEFDLNTLSLLNILKSKVKVHNEMLHRPIVNPVLKHAIHTPLRKPTAALKSTPYNQQKIFRKVVMLDKKTSPVRKINKPNFALNRNIKAAYKPHHYDKSKLSTFERLLKLGVDKKYLSNPTHGVSKLRATTGRQKMETMVKHMLKTDNFHNILNHVITTGHMPPYVLPPRKTPLRHKAPLRARMDPSDQKTIIESFLQSEDDSNRPDDALYEPPVHRDTIPSDRPTQPIKRMVNQTAEPRSNSMALPTEAASFQPISREQENAIARDNIPSKQTSKSIMQADFFTQASNKRKKILSKKLFQSLPSYEDLAISHLKSDHEKSLMMEFPKSPFTRDHINSSPINEAVQTDKQLLNTFYQPKDNSFARSNIFQQSFQPTAQEQPPPAFHNAPTFQIPSEQASRAMEPSTSNIEPPHLTSAGVYPEPTSQFHATIDSSSPLEVGSHDLEETSHSYEKPVQRQFSKQESSSLTAEAGAADYQMNSRSGLPSQTISTNDAHTGMNYIVPPPVEIQPLTLTLSSAPAKPHFEQDVRKNLIRQEPELDCGESWEGARGDFGTFCYKQMKMKATFDDALAECRRMESDLFSVLNAYENRYLQDNIHEKFWIGYRDRGMDGNWNWTDGGRSIYTNWGKHSGGDEKRFDCVYMDGEEGQWKDAACNKKQQFLCKKKTQNCPKDWKSLKLNTALGCYKMFEKLSSWEDAERSCQENGAHLASLISDNEQTMVYQVYSSKTFWIGFNDRESEGDWVWSDRMTSSFTNWAAKSPSNGGVSCASMISGGEWHDDPCAEKLQFICKKKGPGKPEKIDGTDSDGVLLPVARLMNRPETKPSHIYDELAKGGSRPVTPKYFWPLLKTSHPGLAGNRPMAAHGDVRLVPGGVALDGIHGFLDGGDFHGKCVADPEKCSKGFAIAIHVFFDKSVRAYKTAHCVVDTSGGSKGFTIFIESNKLNYRVVTETRTWNLRTDLAVESWQQIVMSWHKDKGISVFVNGALKEVESSSKKSDIKTQGPARLIIGREDKDKGPYTCTKMVVASVAIFTKVLTVEDVPFAFTYGDTVVASYRWLMTNLQDGIVPGAPEVEVNHNPINVDGGIFIDGNSNWLEIDDIDPLIGDPFSKSKHGFSVSFKVKFDQRVREYKQARYIMDSGGHIGGVRGISVYVVNDNLYFQVVDSPDEDILIWKVRAPIYTVRWQRVLMTWRLDKGLWVYLDGAFRGYTKTPTTLPEQLKDTPKKLIVGRNSVGPDYMGAQFAFGCLALYGRYLPRKDADLVFGGADSPFPGIVREVWKNTPGENITTLEANPDYPNSPSTIEIIENFDAPFNVDNDYGSKLKGYFVAPETGNTTFYLACSKACQLFFSADEESKNKTRIAALDRPTWHNQWNKYANQSAHDIYLVAGKYYFLEAIHKGVDASDSLSVGVRLPTGRLQRPISIENLQWRLPGNEHAGLIREVWYDLPGYSIVDLNSNINFPSKPSTTEVVDKFDAPFNVDDNYGARISGYFHAPDTGEYRFYLATDSSGELWLSTDDQENNLVKIVTLNGWTDHNQWLKYPEQKSSKIFLVSGRNYFIRAYMKADKLGDCASVAVELPSGHFEGPIKKKHLSWKLTNTKEGPGPKEIIEPLPKPVGLYTLNDASVKDILLPGDNKLILGDVDLTTGPFGVKDDAFLFKGNRSSYIEIPNDGRLDVRHSITLLANVFPTGEDGPIINYKRDGWGVHLWQFSGTQLFVRFVTRDGKMTAQPMGTRVLQLNKWNQVGASYNHNSGVAQLWHDGKMVKSRNIGQLELSTNASVRLGAKEGDDRYFRGKMSCVQIYDRALTADQVGEVRHCPNKNGANESAGEELTVFGQGSGMEQIYEESEAMENRIGEDTEEELIVEGEKRKVSRCDPSPCVNEGTCVDDDKKIDGYKCVCRHQYAGKHCQVSKESAPVVKRTVIPSPTNTTPDSSKREDVTMLYQKLGCYKDDSVNRDLKAKMSLSQATQESCVHACAKDDVTFSYFGLQNGQSCFCGASYGKYGKIADTFCDRKCEGNPDEDCGGELASNLFFFGANKNYTIKTFTGKQSGAGTDAKIFAEFIGDRGNSGFRQLDSKLDKYEPGSIDTLQFSLPDLGNLKRMKILHDNTGTAPSWFLEKVDVTDSSGHVTEFPCNDWLSETQSGGKLERELLARSTISRPS